MTFLQRVCTVLDDAGVPYALVGGQAVALQGVVRATVDVDVVLRWQRQIVESAEAALRKLGLVSQLPITAAEVVANREEYIHKRNLVAWNFYNPNAPMEQVDIIITYDLADKQVDRVALSESTVAVLPVPALIEMKRASGRRQDIEDAQALENLE